MGEHVVDLAGDAVALVKSGGAVLLRAKLLGVRQERCRLLGLDAVAEQEPAEEEPEDHEQRNAEQSPRANSIREPAGVYGDDTDGGDCASGPEPEIVGGGACGHGGEDDEGPSALGERRPPAGHGARRQSEGQHPAEERS